MSSRAARARGVRVLGELEVGWRMLPNDVVAITGSNGKTTTTELVGAIHRAAGVPVAVAGNVGTALSSLAGALPPDAVVVCECSSFQLEDTEAFAPDAAGLINLAPDHLDRHGSFAAYRAAKLRIFEHQPPGTLAVLPRGLAAGGRAERVVFVPPSEEAEPAPAAAVSPPPAAGSPPAARPRHVDVDARDGMLRWRGAPVMPVSEIRLRGAHNLENAMVATALALARGLDPAAVRTALRELRRRRAPPRGGRDAARRPLRGRLEGDQRRLRRRRSRAPSPAACTPSWAAAARARTMRRWPPPRPSAAARHT